MDRIVGLGAVKLILDRPGELRLLNWIFNPGRKCSPGATAKHGWDDATLRYQDRIDAYVKPLHRWLGDCDLLVAHNAAFDCRFLAHIFEKAQLSPLIVPSECTMLAWREQEKGSAALDAIVARLGLPPRLMHSALQDAWYCMQVFLWMRGLPWRLNFTAVAEAAPSNFRALPVLTVSETSERADAARSRLSRGSINASPIQPNSTH